jgi:co-chaperonin GroES (HSP10)
MIIPAGHRVLVEQVDFQEQDEVYKSATAVGIVLVHDKNVRNQESVDVGTIVLVGPNAWKGFDGGEPWAQIGDTIVFARHAGKRVDDPAAKDRHFLVLNDDDVVAVIKE